MSNDFNNLYTFSNYRLNGRERNLWRENELIPLSPKLFDTLRLLVERGGEIVSKDEMLENVWADSYVDESNLTQNIYTLRQIFGKENKFIETVPRKGYRFIEPVTIINNDPAIESQTFQQNISAEPDHEVIIHSQGSNNSAYPRKHLVGITAFTLLMIAAAALLAYSFFPFGSKADDGISINSLELKSITDTGNSVTPAISSDGDLIVYIDEFSNERILKLRDSASGETIAIEIAGNLQPGFIKFSHDDREIFFRVHGRLRSGQKLYRVSYFGGEPKLVAENTWGKFDLSPDGKYITFFRANKNLNKDILLTKDLITGEEKTIVELEAPKLFFLPIAPAWSPDGNKIAYITRPLSGHRTDITVVDVKSREIQQINTELSKLFQIVWHKNNKHLFAISKEVDKGRQIFSVEYPTGTTKRITNDFNDYEGLSITADSDYLVSETRLFQSNLWVYRQDDNNTALELTSGSYGHHSLAVLKFATEDRIIYDARNEVERDLWQMSISTGEKSRLTQNNGSRNVDVTTTSDGKYVYFSSNRTGIDNIWRMGQDGSDPVQMTFATDEAHWMPALSFDEKHIYYLARTSTQNQIRKLDLETMKSEIIYVSKDFIPGHFIEASSDGKYISFAITKAEADNENNNGTDSVTNMTIGFLDLLNTEKLIQMPIKTSRPKIHFTNGGKTFDYIQDNQILRQNISKNDASPETVFSIENEKIYNFDWSLSGLDIVIARGSQRSNIILISLK